MTMRIMRAVPLVVVAMCAFLWSLARAEGPDKTKPRAPEQLLKGASTPQYSLLNINNLTTWTRADGYSNHTPMGGDGLRYPRGTGNAIYLDGLVYGGKVFLDAARTMRPAIHPVRVGGSHYGVGTREGWVEGFGATAVAADPRLPTVGVYRIRRDYASMSEEELRRDAAEFFEIPPGDVTDAQMALVRTQYEKDWTEWPVRRGAPFIDRNGNGVYDPPPPFSKTFTVDSLIAQGKDEPGVAGVDPNSPADQVLWHVYNDLDRALSIGFLRSEPIGLEIQKTIWGYKRTDAMGNLYFTRYKIINKGGVDIGGGVKGAFYIDSMFVCQWSDPDLGSFTDDLVGCDTTLSMAFVYNANAIDATYRRYNLPPPAVGYDFLAGPIVPDPTGTAVFDFKYRPGFRNLGMSSFAYFSAGSPFSDPPYGRSALANYSVSSGRWWKMLRGFAPVGDMTTADTPYPHPPGMAITKFPLSGDPVARTGFLDGLGTLFSFTTGDRRFLLNAGPFSMAPGDTQEVTVGVVAGLGSDRLSSISVMKFNDRFVQITYDALFQVPRAPVAPDVKVAELDGQIVLEWGSNLTRVADTEQRVNQPGGYTFEGYNVYQLPSRGSRLSEAVRIVTYDLPSDPTVVLDEQFDQRSGQILKLPVQFGTNSGVVRFFNFKRDYVRDIDKIYNGQEYYLAVTAYSIATVPGFLPAALESDAIVLTVRPKVPFGKIYGARYGDTLRVTKTGISDGKTRPIVVDPTASTGDTYEVRFADAGGGNTTWSLINVTKNRTLLSNQTNQSGDDNYNIVEGGIFLKVEGPPPGIKRLDMFDTDDQTQWGWSITGGARRFTWAGGADGLGFEGFRGAFGWASPYHYFILGRTPSSPILASDLKAVELRLVPTDVNGVFDANHANASFAYRYLRLATAAPAQPEFAPWIVNRAGGYAYQDFRKSAPLAVYNMDANPPQRLAIGYLENNASLGSVNGFYWPPDFNARNNTAGTGPREWLYIFNVPYSETPDANLQRDILNNDLPVMYWSAKARRGNVAFQEGDKIMFHPNRVNTPATVFTYSLPAAQTGLELEKASAEKVGVFPNPYYAFNAAETNRFFRFVTFNNLPRKATLRIFNLAGQLVRTLEKDDASQFLRWDLNNRANFPVASGIYIVHIDMPEVGVTKVLKVAIIQEQEILDAY